MVFSEENRLILLVFGLKFVLHLHVRLYMYVLEGCFFNRKVGNDLTDVPSYRMVIQGEGILLQNVHEGISRLFWKLRFPQHRLSLRLVYRFGMKFFGQVD